MLEFPELAEDEDLRLDTLEGETNLFDVLAIIVDDIRNATTMQEAIDIRLRDLKFRLERYEQRERAWRKLAKQLMDVANLRKVTLTEATLSIRHGQPSVQIVDQSFLPDALWRIRKEPNLSMIKDMLKSGKNVPGAVLNNSPDTLTILTK